MYFILFEPLPQVNLLVRVTNEIQVNLVNSNFNDSRLLVFYDTFRSLCKLNIVCEFNS